MSGGKAATSPAPREAAAHHLDEMLIAGAESVLSLEVRVKGGVFKPARLVEREGQRVVWQVGDVEVRVFFACSASTVGVKRGRGPDEDESTDSAVWGMAAKKVFGSLLESSPAAPASPAASAVSPAANQAAAASAVPAAAKQAMQVSPAELIGLLPAAWAAGTVKLGADGKLTSRAKKLKEGERSFKCGQCGSGCFPAPKLTLPRC
ncbi:hypothetical protein T484DRAFT_1787898 [Baffinella frigidus]|nr:hypothetical protein T484DRAFT_1787898 [Cryptophyta sp. CCMP2293]